LGVSRTTVVQATQFLGVREQFKLPLTCFEAQQQNIATLASLNWQIQAAVDMTNAMLEQGKTGGVYSLLISALIKAENQLVLELGQVRDQEIIVDSYPDLPAKVSKM